jgi:hypothetical protein
MLDSVVSPGGGGLARNQSRSQRAEFAASSIVRSTAVIFGAPFLQLSII